MAFDYLQLQSLAAVVRHASFQIAADRLLVTQSAISQRIKALESAAGQPLLVRASPPRPTALGQRYLLIFAQMEALVAELGSPGKGAVRIPLACNHESFHLWFSKCIADFSNEHGVLFEMQLEDQDQTLRLLREARALGCVSTERGPAQGCYSYPIQSMAYACVATPEFIKKHSLDTNRKSKILTAPTVVFGPLDRIHDAFLAELLGEKKVPPYEAHVIPSVSGILDYVLRSAAYAVLPEDLLTLPLQAGRVVDLFPKTKLKVPLYWHCVQTEIPLLQALTKKILAARGAGPR